MEIYDSIGEGYGQLRKPDSRIGAAVTDALGDARSVLNVGVGAGSYEPRDRELVAVEPSGVMIRQRGTDAAKVIQASASGLPFEDDSFDACLGILTIHHWPGLPSCLAELRRVARRRVVLLTWDPEAPGFWLTDYFPEILEIDRRIFPGLDALGRALGRAAVRTLPIPADCSDGFLGAYWQRPEAYLDAHVRGAISTFTKLGDISQGLEQLAGDLASGAWESRHGHLRGRDSLDLGYRLVTATLGVNGDGTRGVQCP